MSFSLAAERSRSCMTALAVCDTASSPVAASVVASRAAAVSVEPSSATLEISPSSERTSATTERTALVCA